MIILYTIILLLIWWIALVLVTKFRDKNKFDPGFITAASLSLSFLIGLRMQASMRPQLDVYRGKTKLVVTKEIKDGKVELDSTVVYIN